MAKPDSQQAELCFVSGAGADDPVTQSVMSQLLEYGVDVEFDQEHNLPARLPDDFTGCRAVLLDAPAYYALREDAAQMARLEDFARAGRAVSVLPQVNLDAMRGSVLPFRHQLDALTHLLVHDLLLHAELTLHHPRVAQRQAVQSDQALFGRQRAALLAALPGTAGWHEFTLHWWQAAQAVLDAGLDDGSMEQALLAAMRRAFATPPVPFHHDGIGGLCAARWLAQRTGERAALDTACAVMDQVLRRRPRLDGAITGAGFADDPLALRAGVDLGRRISGACTTLRGQAVWTEAFHFHAPVLTALGVAAGREDYLREAELALDVMIRRNRRADGLFAHTSAGGTHVGAAWGRGQTHALLGMTYATQELGLSYPLGARLAAEVRVTAEALLPWQDPRSGLWRNVIDHPDARLETTATINCLNVFQDGVRGGWLDRERFEPALERGWAGVKSMTWRDGFAATCRGTGSGSDPAYYLGRPQGWAQLPQALRFLAQRLSRQPAAAVKSNR